MKRQDIRKADEIDRKINKLSESASIIKDEENEVLLIYKYEYLLKKRDEVIETIKPKLNAWGIKDKNYDYEIIENQNGHYNEVLRIYDTKIGCDCNSIFAVEMEVLKYLIVVSFCRYCGFPFSKQLKNFCMRYWKDE